MFKLKAVGVFVAAVVPAVVWDWLFPARFSVTFNDENHQAVCHFFDPGYAAQFDTLNHFGPEALPEQPTAPSNQPAAPLFPPQTNVLPNVSAGSSAASAASYRVAESFEDKTNPFRNLEDPRFRK